MDYLLFIPIIVSFLVTLFLMPYWIRKAKQIGLFWDDMNKTGIQKVAGSGGIIAILGFIIGVLIYVAYRTFYLKIPNGYLVEIFALLCSVLILAGIGIIDDLLGWQHGGLSRRSRIIMVLFASIPLVVINAGDSLISLPFIGDVSLGLIYPLILVPLAIVGVTTTFNFLAGFNGLEAGQGILLILAATLVAFFTGNAWLSVVGICMVLSLLAFLLFNFSPARVFPGDSLTYAVGGLFAIMTILGNFEKIALFFFIPYIIEVILKSRGKLVKQSFGKPNPDGSLSMRYDKVYGLTHLGIYLLDKIGIKPTEKKVVYLIWAFQLVIIVIGFLIFRKGIFL
jgi:UDP-N-acetylglucosamine--dolichyl-phosphate N-acetylglucosaminephosphotransferase